MRGLAGKSVLITGGGGDLGYACALRLLEEKCDVSIWDIADPPESNVNLKFDRVDVTDSRAVAEAVEAIIRRAGKIDVLVNAATRFLFKGTAASRQEWETILAVNIVGVSQVTHEVVHNMKREGSGSIINFSSISGFIGQPDFATYNATKFAIRGLTKCWARDFAAWGIRVNTVCPGYIYTSAFVNSCKALGLDVEEENKRASAMHMLNRQGRPDEVAGAVAFLASEDSTFITGTDLLVDGGYLAQ